MCINTCDNGHLDQDAGPTFLTWQNGRYVPAPPMFNVPGLRPILQKQPRQATWRVTAGPLVRTCASPDTSCSGQAPNGTQPADLENAISPITAPDFIRNGSQTSRSTLVTRSTDCQSDTAAADSRTEAHTNDNAVKQGHKRAQKPPPSLARSANGYPTESRSSAEYPSFVVADSAVEGDIRPVESHQTSRSAFSRFRRPLVELSSGIQNKPNLKDRVMPSAATITKPNLEIPKTKSAIPRQQHHVSTGTTMLLKPILKKHSTPTNLAAQSTRHRRKHVHFTFGINEDGMRAHGVSTAAHQPRAIPTPPPLRRSSTPPTLQHSQPMPSSTGNARPHMTEGQARLAKAHPRSSSSGNCIRHRRQMPQAVAQPGPNHPTLTAENLAALSSQQKTCRIHMGRLQEDEDDDDDDDDDDDVASNTDFELAVRMNERAMRMNRKWM